MWYCLEFLVVTALFAEQLPYAASNHEYNPSGSSGNVIHIGSTGSKAAPIVLDGTRGSGFLGGSSRGAGTPAAAGTASQVNDGTFGPAGPRRVTDFGGVGQPGVGVGGTGVFSGVGFGQVGVGGVGVIGQSGVGGAGVFSGQPGVGGARVFSGQPGVTFGQAGVGGPGVVGGRGAGVFGSGQGAARVVQAPITPTVTKTVTIDHFVTLTDLAFHSVPVTLTDLIVRTTTITTRQAIHTPVDDRVALQTTVVVRPTSLTVTCSKFDYRIVTDVSVDYATITHTAYIIRQITYTTTATQVSTYPATMVRTIVRTQRTTLTDYHTITNTVYAQGGYY